MIKKRFKTIILSKKTTFQRNQEKHEIIDLIDFFMEKS